MFRIIEDWPSYGVDTNGVVWSFKRIQCGDAYPMKGCVGKAGHTKVIMTEGNRRTQRLVHHLVLEAFVGPCPPGMECCHLDGNARNNRLDNLRWDTRKGNMADAIRHGTTQRGERTHFAKLTEAQVLEIRELSRQGVARKDVAQRFGVLPSQVWHIVGGRSWKHLGGAIPIVRGRGTTGSRNANARLTEDDVREIRRLHRSGIRNRELAAQFGVGKNNISMIITGATWKHVQD